MNELSAGLSRLFHARRRADLVHIENPGLRPRDPRSTKIAVRLGA